MAHLGNTCGGVKGTLMVIGMKYERTRPDVLVAKDKIYTVVDVF